MMRSRIALTFIAAFATAGSLVADEATPKPLSFTRYASMTEKSPFAVATAAAPVVVAPNFAKDLYVANAARSPDGDLVTIGSSADRNLKEYLTSTAPNPHGYSISNIEWSDKVGATKVTIGKDGQFATLTFNQALLSQPIASAQPQPPINQPAFPQPAGVLPAPNPGMPMLPTINPAPPKPMPVPSIPTLPTPPTRVRSVIPRNPQAPVQPGAGDN